MLHIICGKDPKQANSFVGTKGVFAGKAKPKFTEKDIDTNPQDKMVKGELKSAEGLRTKLRVV